MTRNLEIISTVRSSKLEPFYEERVRRLVILGSTILRYNISKHDAVDYVKDIFTAKDIISSMNLLTKIKIMVDIPLPGTKIRLGRFPQNEIKVAKGQKVIFKSSFEPVCFGDFIPIKCDAIGNKVFHEQIIVYGDGEGRFIIDDIIDDNSFSALSQNSFSMWSHKGIHIGSITNQMSDPIEVRKYIDFLSSISPDMVAFSFVESSEQVINLKKLFSAILEQKKIDFVSKIETSTGVKNIEDIAELSDYIMIARGDLALTSPFTMLGIYQKRIIEACKKKGVNVYVATDILDSLYFKSIPSRAEIIDITDLIISEVAGVVLSAPLSACENSELVIGTIKEIQHLIEK